MFTWYVLILMLTSQQGVSDYVSNGHVCIQGIQTIEECYAMGKQSGQPYACVAYAGSHTIQCGGSK